MNQTTLNSELCEERYGDLNVDCPSSSIIQVQALRPVLGIIQVQVL